MSRTDARGGGACKHAPYCSLVTLAVIPAQAVIPAKAGILRPAPNDPRLRGDDRRSFRGDERPECGGVRARPLRLARSIAIFAREGCRRNGWRRPRAAMSGTVGDFAHLAIMVGRLPTLRLLTFNPAQKRARGFPWRPPRSRGIDAIPRNQRRAATF